MIGNDIVDLRSAREESNWQRKGFLNKVFLAHEREQIGQSAAPHHMVWLLWSMKEAAYKADQRLRSPGRSLNWHRLSCRISRRKGRKTFGTVMIDENIYYTTSDFFSEGVHTLAQKNPDIPAIFPFWNASSASVKRTLLQYISNIHSLDQECLRFKKDSSGIPYIACNDQKLFDGFSFSDHGRFSGFSLSLRIS